MVTCLRPMVHYEFFLIIMVVLFVVLCVHLIKVRFFFVFKGSCRCKQHMMHTILPIQFKLHISWENKSYYRLSIHSHCCCGVFSMLHQIILYFLHSLWYCLLQICVFNFWECAKTALYDHRIHRIMYLK